MTAALLAGLFFAQTPNWKVDPSGTLLWGGVPYVPIGARIPGTVDAVEQASKAGVKDLLVELPADGRSWPAVFDALRKSESRFFVEINSMVPSSVGVAVEPESYRLGGISAKTRLQASVPGARSALIVMATADGTIQQTKLVVADPSGLISEDLDPLNTVEHTALVYPTLKDARVPDGWDGLDEHRDQLISAFTKAGNAPGFRGVLNPLGSIARFPDAGMRFVPTSERFRTELEVYLKRKYGTQKRVEQAWGMQAPDFTSIAQMTHLVPLWSPKRGLNAFWDSDSSHTYLAISRNSTAWGDIQTVFNTAVRRRMINLCQALQGKLGVPVIQTWSGWNGPYEGNAAGLAGVAVRLEGDTISDLNRGTAKAASTLSRWDRAGLLIATDVQLEGELGETIAQSRQLGMRGWFFEAVTEAELQKVAAVAAQDHGDWLTPRPTFLNFPESAQNPAVPMQLGSNAWWVPAPLDGNRIDYGRKISGYVMRTSDGDETVLWSNQSSQKVRLRFIDPKKAVVRTMTGGTVPTKITKTTVELTLGTEPIVIAGAEVPVPQESIDETMQEFTTLVGLVPQQVQNVIDDIESFRQVSSMVNENPAAAYITMRYRLERLRRSLAPMVWIEAENSREHNWSEVQQDSSASGESVLMLSTRVNPIENLFRAKYLVNPRTPGGHDLWASVKGSNAAIGQLYVEINGERKEAAPPPLVSVYGNGFGWVKLGSLTVTGPQQLTIEVKCPSPIVGPIALDSLLLATPNYKPSGPFLNWYPPLSPVPPKR
ncbi:MAG: hypothetical protein JNK63_09195 [Chthonomonas sp.]|nr:hypothetical protein [Chthonomonas sp.]